MKRPIFLAGLAVVLSWGLSLRAAEPEPKKPARPVYEEKKFFDPEGINKWYMGRQIAMVMGHQAAGWLERPEREKEENPAKLMEALKLRVDDVIADVGAGSGYFTFRMAQKAPFGKVYAVDIQPEMLDIIKKRMKEKKIANVVPVLGTESDPKLPENAVDLILMVDVYHELNFPYEMTEKMVQSLKPGGRMVFVEYRLEDPEVPIKLVHKMSEKQVIKEMTQFPLRHAETIGTLPWQHILIFRKPEAAPPPRAG